MTQQLYSWHLAQRGKIQTTYIHTETYTQLLRAILSVIAQK